MDMNVLEQNVRILRQAKEHVLVIGLSNWKTSFDESEKAVFDAFIDRPVQAEQLYRILAEYSDRRTQN